MTKQPADIPFCPSPDPNPAAPSFDIPDGACDTHFHVFPAGHEHRYVPDRSYTPPPLEVSDYHDVAAALQIDRAVVIQASVYGEDNTALLEVSAAEPDKLRAVVSVTNDVTDAELAAFHAKGARGIRVNLVDSGGMTFSSVDEALNFTARIADLGWHIEFLAHVETFDDINAILDASHVPVVFGHLGYAKVGSGQDDQGVRRFLRAFEGGKAWVKLTGPYRISNLDRPPYTDIADQARALLAANPARLIWGSDWPHVRHVGVMPNDGALLDQLVEWGCDAGLRKQILVDNPAALYGFQLSDS